MGADEKREGVKAVEEEGWSLFGSVSGQSSLACVAYQQLWLADLQNCCCKLPIHVTYYVYTQDIHGNKEIVLIASQPSMVICTPCPSHTPLHHSCLQQQ